MPNASRADTPLVVCPYTKLDGRTRVALTGRAARLAFVHVGGSPSAYADLLVELWARGEAFVLVEHDIEIHDGVLPELAACPEPWCLFPYARLLPGPKVRWDGRGWGPGVALLSNNLGCTRWSAELMAALPDLMTEVRNTARPGLPAGHWSRLDDVSAQLLSLAGYEPHVHHPEVLHHHWLDRWNCCACGCG